MAGAEIRQLGADMVAVPLIIWQRVETLLVDMDTVRTRLDLLESVSVTGSDYLSRQQAMQFLHVGSTKLWELKNQGAIETTDSTGKPLYKTSSCREYLAAQGYSQAHIQARFQEILQSKQKK